ncbi:MAG: HAD family hydrolase [Elusimicrobiaceae bacterium]|nr:HAD family hydrolase [Elusimicrobiaceae bacterium]
MSKKLVIFDLDGTLLDTISDLAQSTNQALEKLGFALHPQNAYYRFVGSGINKLFERALPPNARTTENIAKVRALFVPYYDEHNADLTRPYAGIVELLENLQKKGFVLAVASNKYQSATEKLVHHYFPQIAFAAVLGQRDGLPVKPDPLFVKEILKSTQISSQETLYVGDSDVDMLTAQNAQVDSCAVTWGFRTKEELMRFNPAFVAEKAEDIAKILL